MLRARAVQPSIPSVEVTSRDLLSVLLFALAGYLLCIVGLLVLTNSPELLELAFG